MNYQYHIFSPYRVCPLGAHVDHQHGIVTGFAIDKGVDLWFNPTDDGVVRLKSLTFNGDVEFPIYDSVRIKQGHWGDYARGAKYALSKRYKLSKGIEGVIKGSLPIGGLSSSAAVLVAYVMAFAKANGITLSDMERIKIASEAEREYIGLNNGILDQASIVLGRRDNLLFLDTNSEEFRLIEKSPELPDFELAIIFSGLTRSLVSSDYNLRVAECRTAAWNMLAYENLPLKNHNETFLRDIPYETYLATRERMPKRFARRAEHFYSEYDRVKMGVAAWEDGNIKLFGELSIKSCESSIHNYECGSAELIEIFDILRETEGVWGGRFSGAGFKGACIAIIDPKYRDTIKETITQRYLKRFPEYSESFEIHFCHSDNGARFID